MPISSSLYDMMPRQVLQNETKLQVCIQTRIWPYKSNLSTAAQIGWSHLRREEEEKRGQEDIERFLPLE